jgi:hypothetical protein
MEILYDRLACLSLFNIIEYNSPLHVSYH